ncbi:MAG: hypothetical protein V7731_09515 [Amphritea sp.]
MKLKTLLAFFLVLPLSSPMLAGQEKSKAGEKAHEGKRTEQLQIKDERSALKASEMEQRKVDCKNNSKDAACSGLQKGRNKSTAP